MVSLRALAAGTNSTGMSEQHIADFTMGTSEGDRQLERFFLTLLARLG